MKKNSGNSGLYGRVTKKQMGGTAKPVGMSGPSRGIVAGEMGQRPSDKYLPSDFKDFYDSVMDRKGPKAPPMRTNDFRDEDMNGVDDRDESPRGKKRPSGKDGNVRGTIKTGPGRGTIKTGPRRGTIKTGPGRGPRGPSRDQLQRIQEMLAGKADRGGRGTRIPGLPGGGRLMPPEMGPNPDAERMGPRRFGGMGASIIEALGIKSDKMGDKSRKEPPRPRTTGGTRGRQRRN